MKDTYELYMEESILQSNSFADLKRLAEANTAYYEIYLVRPSRMNSKNFYRKALIEVDIERAISRIKSGHAKKDVAKQLHVGMDTLSRLIRNYENELLPQAEKVDQ